MSFAWPLSLLATFRAIDAFRAIREDRVVAVVRAERVADPVGLTKVLAVAGIRCVEFTLTIRDAFSAIAAAAASGAIVGAGTVLRPEEARRAVAAGASFVVSPTLEPHLVDAIPGVPVFLGAFSPTEVIAAHRAGATGVKLVPARLGGPAYLKDLLGPFPEIPLIPSGGIDDTNARQFLEAGAVAVYAGSKLVPAGAAASGHHEEIAARAGAFVRALG